MRILTPGPAAAAAAAAVQALPELHSSKTHLSYSVVVAVFDVAG